ncbi:hypothetical protein [Rhizobium sp. SYY.PMSO]|uniref:hypothetical protein n=1 Tax=Rhizobium sp. SYY.PMSO TaxID=3382192 RepID=UPI00398FE614
MSDLLREVERGQNYELVAVEVANEHKVNPALLRRKFSERYGSPEATMARYAAKAESEKPMEIDYILAEQFVRFECLRAGVRSKQFLPLKGKRQLVIATRIVDLKSYRLVLDLRTRTAEWELISDLREIFK